MDPITTKAYAIFRSESAGQLGRSKEILARLPHLGDAELAELRVVFHRFKGGAGFFGLTRLSEVAGELECLVKQGPPGLVGKTEQIQILMASLEDQIEHLPSPVT